MENKIIYQWKSNDPIPHIGSKLYSKNNKWFEVIDISDNKLTLLELRTYHSWAGQPKGVPEDRTRCIESVCPPSRGVVSSQCEFKRGKGKDKLYCGKHAC